MCVPHPPSREQPVSVWPETPPLPCGSPARGQWLESPAHNRDRAGWGGASRTDQLAGSHNTTNSHQLLLKRNASTALSPWCSSPQQSCCCTGGPVGRGREEGALKGTSHTQQEPCTPPQPTHWVGCDNDLTVNGEGLICQHTGQEEERGTSSFYLPLSHSTSSTTLMTNITLLNSKCHYTTSLPSPPLPSPLLFPPPSTDRRSLLVSKDWARKGTRPLGCEGGEV